MPLLSIKARVAMPTLTGASGRQMNNHEYCELGDHSAALPFDPHPASEVK